MGVIIMRQTIAGLALLVGLAGCLKEHVPEYQRESKVNTTGKTTTVRIPEDCYQLIDVRYLPRDKMSDIDEVLCSDKDGNRVLYIKPTNSNEWSARRYETSKTKNIVESPE